MRETKYIDNEDKNQGEKIAIIGMSCRFPAGSNSIEEFWDCLIEGRDGIVDIPKTRWDFQKYFDENKDIPGKMYCKKGGFLDIPIDEFDAGFFNISPLEADYIDPQQRLLLELTWEAFENAGIDITKYNGKNVGVYTGLSSNEYSQTGLYSGDMTKIGPYALTGGSMSTLCGRVSYIFGFEGPSFTVDTACSSGLTAFHLACSAINSGETDIALVAGVNLILSPVISVAFSKLQAISPDGHSKAFDANANGYARAEGGGVIILKKVSDAIRDKNDILGIVGATGINQDGKSNGLTAPNGSAQAKLIKETLNRGQLDASDISYVEMHGTGTPLGDPIEVNAVSKVYCEKRNSENKLKIGSVKSNIGHLEPAAGMASIIKVLLSFKNNLIPANLYFSKPNPYIDWENAGIEVVSKHQEWNKSEKPRRVGINGFGFGGSNAHVILEEYKEKIRPVKIEDATDGLNYILKMSAKSEASLRNYVKKYIDQLEKCDDDELSDVIYSANRGKCDFSYRLAVEGVTKDEIIEKLKGYLIGSKESGIYHTQNNTVRKNNSKYVFMFTGQGSQYVNMGRVLFESNITFKKTMLLCDKLFQPFLNKSLVDLLYGENASNDEIKKTVYAQPVIFSINYALYSVWKEYGITPSIVMGHSIGEYAAAVVSGVLSIEDAVKIVSLRGILMDNAPGAGAMGSVLATREKVEELIGNYSNVVSLAAVNAKESCVISGEADAVINIMQKAKEEGIKVKQLKVSHAFHSSLMETILDEFKSGIEDITFNTPSIRYISSLYAQEIDDDSILGADYWTKHIRERVDFYDAIKSIKNSEDYVFLEVGASQVLSALCKLILNENHSIIGTLNIKEDPRKQLARNIAKLYVSGASLDWSKIEFQGKRNWNRVPTPNYPYDKSKCGIELIYDNCQHTMSSFSSHPILGERIESPIMGDAIVYQRKFTAQDPYFMTEHIIFEIPISPAAAHVSLVLSAVKDFKNPDSCTLKSIEFRAPLSIIGDEERIVQICFKEKKENYYNFSLVSKDANEKNTEWVTHAAGEVKINEAYVEQGEYVDINPDEEWIVDTITPEESAYELMCTYGFYLGDGFRRILNTLHSKEKRNRYLSRVLPLDNIPDLDKYIIYPGTIDSIFQTGILQEVSKSLNNEELIVDIKKQETMIPYFIEEFTYNFLPMNESQVYTDVATSDQNFLNINISAYNEKGKLFAAIKSLMTKVTNKDNLLKGIQRSYANYFYKPEWIEKEIVPEETESDKKYIIVAKNALDADIISNTMINYGFKPLRIIHSEEFRRDGDTYFINQTDKENWCKLLEDVISLNSASKFKIIFSVDNGGYARDSYKIPDGDFHCLKSLLMLVQSIGEVGISNQTMLKIVSKNLHSLDRNKRGDLSQATVWGFAKVLSVEFPNVFNGIIDFDNESVKDGSLIIELINNKVEEISLKNGKRYVQKLTKYTKRSIKNASKVNNELIISKNATYVITGGTGAVGLVYAETLVKNGAENLILICRKNPKEANMSRIEKLKNQGVEVKLCFADVSDMEKLKLALDESSKNMPDIKGVIHAAGTVSDKAIIKQEWENFEKVCLPKVNGAINIFNALENSPLDFIILLSSISSMIGNFGQSNYASANYFLNRFAEEASMRGVNTYSVCWGPWAEAGMAIERNEVQKNMNKLGFNAFTNDTGSKIIETYLKQPTNELMIADIDWDKLQGGIQSRDQKVFLEYILGKNVSKEENENEENHFIEMLQQADKDERNKILLETLQEICSRVMGFGERDMVKPHISLSEQGADSLMMFSIRSTVNKYLKMEFEVSIFYNYPTLFELTDYILHEVLFTNEEIIKDELEMADDVEILNRLEQLI